MEMKFQLGAAVENTNPSVQKPMKAILASTFLLASVSASHAASVLGSVSAAPNSTTATAQTLPSGTDTDWGYYQQTGTPSPTVTYFDAANSSNTGGRSFTVTAVNGGTLRGPGTPDTSSPFSYFDFANGTSPGTGDNVQPTGIFNSVLGTTGVNSSAGVQLSLTGFTGQSVIQLWTFAFQSTGLLEVFINGSDTVEFSQSISGAVPQGGKDASLVTLDFTPDSALDTVEIRYRLTSTLDATNGHVGFQAVAISPIPEPASLALLALTGGLFGLRRRR